MIQIFVDSGANLSPELREQYNIHLLPMALTIDDQPAPEGWTATSIMRPCAPAPTCAPPW